MHLLIPPAHYQQRQTVLQNQEGDQQLTSNTKQRLGAMELLGIIGFSLLFGWYLTVFFWQFTVLPDGVSFSQQLIVQLIVFAGLALGNILIRITASGAYLHNRSKTVIIFAIVLCLPISVLIFLSNWGIVSPFWLFCIFGALTGLSAAYLIVSWMDICGKTRVRNYLVFTALSFAIGAALFLLCTLMPAVIQPIISVVYLLISFVFLIFVDAKSDTVDDRVVKNRSEFFSSPKELEPLLFVFGATFGVAFVLAYTVGPEVIVFGMLSILVGSILIATLTQLNLNITTVSMFRVLIVIMVAVCLVFPFVSRTIQIICSCIAIALWAVFSEINFANIIRQIANKHLKVLYHVSAGLIPKSCGFVVGWILASLLVFSGSSEIFLQVLMLGLVFILVLIIMISYPSSSHHDETALVAENVVTQVPLIETNEELLLKAKCQAAAKQFMLSPREADVLSFLVRGRNADYICSKLVISPHTAKSHIASIYRKTDIHSQQKLMVFIEEFPVKASDIKTIDSL